MYVVFLFIIIITLYYFKFIVKLSIDWKTLYRKGFKKIDNAFGLFAYCGKQGKGKTYSALKFIIDWKLKTNGLIITNVRSFKLFSDTVFIDDIQDLINFVISFCDEWSLNHPDTEPPNIIIFFDEIFTVLEKQTRISDDILSFISQLRKRKIVFITTAQEWLEINVTFRRYVRYQIDCNMFSLPIINTAFLLNYVNDGEQLKWNKDENEYTAPRISTKFSKGNKAVIESYDTFETIKVIKKKKNKG